MEIKQHCFSQNSGASDKGGVTSLIMVNAAGEYVKPMIIMKRIRMNYISFKSQFDVVVAEGNPLNFTLGKTGNGWINAKSLNEYLVNTFNKWLDDNNIETCNCIFRLS